MGYTTEFAGTITVDPPLNEQEVEFLNKFADTRRMHCAQGPYYVDRGGFADQEHEDGVIDYNRPPEGQPGLWCQWVIGDEGDIEWDGGEKFYCAAEWMEYIIDHFLKPNCIAKNALPFLQANHTCNGTIEAQGEDMDDRWKLIVTDNVVSTISLEKIKSAFICTDKHIATLVIGINLLRYRPLPQETLQEHANLLMRENIRSVNYRYMQRGKFTKVEFEVDPAVVGECFTAADLDQLARCLQYQSCERPDWERSKAYALLNEMRVIALEQMVEHRLPKSEMWDI